MNFYRIHARNDIQKGFYSITNPYSYWFGDKAPSEQMEEFAKEKGFDDFHDLRREFYDSYSHPNPQESPVLKEEIKKKFGNRGLENFFFGFDSLNKVKRWFYHPFLGEFCILMDLVVSYFEIPDDKGASDKNQAVVWKDTFEELVAAGEFVTMEVAAFIK